MWNYNCRKAAGTGIGTAASPSNRKNVTTKSCASFTDCRSEINITQIDNAKDIDVVMPMYN